MFNSHYVEWRKKRVSFLIDELKVDFSNKKVLELGAGHGDLGAMLHAAGASFVDCVEGRIDHIEAGKSKYPFLNFIHLNLNEEVSFKENEYDIVVHFGVFYHLEKNEFLLKNLKNIIDSSNGLVFFETEVSDSDKVHTIDVFGVSASDQSISGKSQRPSEAFLNKFLEDNDYKYAVHKSDKLNCPGHVYDWESKNDESWSNGRRRFWEIKK